MTVQRTARASEKQGPATVGECARLRSGRAKSGDRDIEGECKRLCSGRARSSDRATVGECFIYIHDVAYTYLYTNTHTHTRT